MEEALAFSSLNVAPIYIPSTNEKRCGRFVYWGDDNKLPNFIWDTYLSCSDLQTLVNRTVDYICGSRIKSTIEEVVKKCITDYVLFGGFAVECLRGRSGKIVQINYIDITKVRVNDTLSTAYISTKGFYSRDVVELPLYNKEEQQNHFIYFYRGEITRNIYPIPMWFAGLKSAVVLNETRNYNLREIQNNFSPNVIIALNGTSIKANELKEIKEKISSQYEGTNNAGKTLLINNANSEGKVEITRLDADKAADVYRNLQESSINDLRTAFSINEVLLGINYNSGFSPIEYENIYKLYKGTIIEPLRKNIKTAFGNIDVDVDWEDKPIEWVQ